MVVRSDDSPELGNLMGTVAPGHTATCSQDRSRSGWIPPGGEELAKFGS